LATGRPIMTSGSLVGAPGGVGNWTSAARNGATGLRAGLSGKVKPAAAESGVLDTEGAGAGVGVGSGTAKDCGTSTASWITSWSAAVGLGCGAASCASAQAPANEKRAMTHKALCRKMLRREPALGFSEDTGASRRRPTYLISGASLNLKSYSPLAGMRL
jgi:hypothetical protein